MRDANPSRRGCPAAETRPQIGPRFLPARKRPGLGASLLADPAIGLFYDPGAEEVGTQCNLIRPESLSGNIASSSLKNPLVWGLLCQAALCGRQLIWVGGRRCCPKPVAERARDTAPALVILTSCAHSPSDVTDSNRPEASPPWRAGHRAATLYSVRPIWGLDHEAVIRFGDRAPRRRAYSC
jgi:hypothetical protein